MRRTDRLMTPDEAEGVLLEGTFGVLSTIDEDGTPYGVPINYAYIKRDDDVNNGRFGSIVMHRTVASGEVLSNVLARPACCLTVISRAVTLPRQFSMCYRSAIARGRVRIVEGFEKRSALEAILRHLAPENVERGHRYIESAVSRVHVLALDIEELSGKHHE